MCLGGNVNVTNCGKFCHFFFKNFVFYDKLIRSATCRWKLLCCTPMRNFQKQIDFFLERPPCVRECVVKYGYVREGKREKIAKKF